jgi:hypothetical protein
MGGFVICRKMSGPELSMVPQMSKEVKTIDMVKTRITEV